MTSHTRFPGALAASLTLTVVVACTSVTPAPTTPPPAANPTPTHAASQTAATSPSQTGQPTPSGESPAPSATGTPGGPSEPPASVDPEIAAQIDSVIDTLPAVRELEPLRDVPFEVVSREQFQAELTELAFSEIPEELRFAEERLYKRLGLLPDDVDMTQLLLDLYGSQVAAYYRPDNGRFYVIERDQPFGGVDKMFAAHEYTHALQDQHFELETNRIKDLSEGDAILAQLAAIEGDATLTMQQWALQPASGLTMEDLVEILTASLSGLEDETLANMPLVLRRQLEFPYTDGFLFIDDVHGLGGFEAVNQAIQTPPASTEQILHPRKFYDGEAPVDVQFDDASTTLGTGWSRVYEQTFGELLIQILATGGESPPMSIPGLPVEWPHAEAAAGWAGDRLAMYENGDGAWAIEWQTAWDTEGDAAEFESRMNEIAGTFDGPMSLEGGLVLVASDQATLDALAAAP